MKKTETEEALIPVYFRCMNLDETTGIVEAILTEAHYLINTILISS